MSLRTKPHKNKKERGRVTPNLHIRLPRKIILDNPELEPQEYWDDWSDHRDGMRDGSDNSKIRQPIPNHWRCHPETKMKIERMNRKLKMHAKIRKARRSKCSLRKG